MLTCAILTTPSHSVRYKCQEPEVVFTTGMKPLGNDEFLIFYGAADSDVGVTKIKVNINH